MNLVVGRITTHPRGFGFVVPDRPLDDVKGDIYIAGSNLNQAMHGDRVVARIERVTRPRRRRPHPPHPGARRVDDRRSLRRRRQGLGFVVPFDRRLIMDVQIPRRRSGGRQAGRHGDRRDHALADVRARHRSAASSRSSATSTSPVSTPRSSSGSTASRTSTARRPSRKRDASAARSRSAISRADRFPAARDGDDRRRACPRFRRCDHDRSAAERTTTGSACTSPTSRTTCPEGSALDDEAYERGDLGVLSGTRGPHVPVGAGDGPLQPEPAGRSSGAVVPDGDRPARERRALRAARRRHPQQRADDVHGGQRHPDGQDPDVDRPVHASSCRCSS